MDPLVIAYVALTLAFVSLCLTLWRTRRSYNDSDIEELANIVGRLSRGQRAATMRRVREEAKGSIPNGAPDADAPSELRGAIQAPQDPRTSKHAIRMKLLGTRVESIR